MRISDREIISINRMNSCSGLDKLRFWWAISVISALSFWRGVVQCSVADVVQSIDLYQDLLSIGGKHLCRFTLKLNTRTANMTN